MVPQRSSSTVASDQSALGLYLAVAAGLITVQALALLAMGLPAICKCGYVALWHGNPSGPETSQHLVDWYSYTHVLHGIGFYLLLWLIAPQTSIGLRFALAIGLEASWEVIENTPLVMDRYHQSALARGYFGDSIVNSVSDTAAAALGFVLARKLPVLVVVVLVIVSELFAGYMVRDNLTLNIIQLIYPSETISKWQEGG
jgi:hypothetical protein